MEAFPDAKIEMIPGSGGVFDVTMDEELIFSKQHKVAAVTPRFPDPDEIPRLAKKKLN